MSDTSPYAAILASAVFTWTLIEALSVAGWLFVAVLLIRSRRSDADSVTIAKQRRSLIVLTGWVCLIAIRLATHTFG